MKNNAKIVLLLSLFTANVSAKQCEFISQLSPYQQDVAYQVYRAGQPYDLGYTALAVAWQESKLGLYKVRVGDGLDFSVGVGHTNVFYKTKGLDAFHKGMWVQSMIDNDAKSIDIMVSDLLYWQSRYNKWRDFVGAYNGGKNINKSYANDVATTLYKLKGCEF